MIITSAPGPGLCYGYGYGYGYGPGLDLDWTWTGPGPELDNIVELFGSSIQLASFGHLGKP